MSSPEQKFLFFIFKKPKSKMCPAKNYPGLYNLFKKIRKTIP